VFISDNCTQEIAIAYCYVLYWYVDPCGDNTDCIREVSGSYLGRGSDYPDERFSSASASKLEVGSSSWPMIASFHILSIHYY